MPSSPLIFRWVDDMNHTFVTIHEHLHSKPLAKLKQWYFTDLEVYAQKNIGFFNPYFRTKPSLQWEHFCGFVPWRNMMFVVVWVAWANKKEIYQFEWIWKCMVHVIQFDEISYYTYHMYNHFVRELFIHISKIGNEIFKLNITSNTIDM